MSSPTSLPSSPLSRTRLRQIALVVKDLVKARYLLTSVLGTEVVFSDPRVARWGIENLLFAIGGDIIEVVAPTKTGTTAGRLLDRRGEGGYMIIMQTGDAKARRQYLEAKDQLKVIWTHEGDDYTAVQYHPRGIKGGMMPELDSHLASQEHPDPLGSRFSPWHAAGTDYADYSAGMRRCSDLHLVGAVCRLAPGDSDTEGAARQWEENFGVARTKDQLAFTNMRMGFMGGEEGKPDGLVSIAIAVEGKERMERILTRARQEGLCGEGWINMVGVRWYLTMADEPKARI